MDAKSSFALQSDVTGTVDLTRPADVCATVVATLRKRFPDINVACLEHGYRDIEAAFWGRYPGLLACDTPYHDLRHSLATSLLMARMIDGYAAAPTAGGPQFDAAHASLATLLALYHDIGFLRRNEEGRINGAMLIHDHEQRSVDFMRDYLAQGSLARQADGAELILATNFSASLDDLLAGLSPARQLISKMLGTADLVSQVSSRYYLERCRYYLYGEFVIAGADRLVRPDGTTQMLYDSGEDLLRKTPGFFEHVVRKRIEGMGDMYHCVAAHFGGDDPYERGMRRNMAFLKEIVASGDFGRLARRPIPLMPLPEAEWRALLRGLDNEVDADE